MIAIVYIVGFFVAYGMIKYERSKTGSNGWNDVAATVIFSLFSWLTVVAIPIVYGIRYLAENDPKPPKWL